jgi:hypothetical protein
MSITSSAGSAAALNLLQTRSQLQINQLRQSTDQIAQSVQLLQGGSAPSGGRGQVIDLLA